jgi:L-ascorbate metabolism protein UlaG (beta-lactamase superfamily)
MNRRRFRTITKSILIIALLTALGVAAYLQHPVFGKLPEDERLARMEDSPHYIDGEFHNLIDTPMLTTDQSQFSMMMENLFRSRGNPRPPAAIRAIKTDLKALDVAEDMVVWLGHSSYFVQIGGQRILIDPVFSTNASPVPLTNTAFDGTSVYTAEDMPDIDVLLITHDHYDHLDYPSIQALQSKVRQVIAGLGIGAHFERWGYDAQKVHEADWYDTFSQSPELQIVVAPARHYSGRTLTRNQSLWVGFALLSSQRRVFFSGDTGYGPHFAELGRRHGPFDWVAVDAGQYDSRWANIHMNPEQAAQAADDLQAHAFTPAHVGRFSISPHDWDEPFKRVTVASQGRDHALWTAEIGRPIYLDGRTQEFTEWWQSVE